MRYESLMASGHFEAYQTWSRAATAAAAAVASSAASSSTASFSSHCCCLCILAHFIKVKLLLLSARKTFCS